MTDTPQQSSAERLRSLPLVASIATAQGVIYTSSAIAAGNLTSIFDVAGLTGFAFAGVTSVALVATSAIDVIDSKRSKFSRTFSAAATCVALSPLAFLAGPELSPLVAFIILPFTTGLSGALGLAAHVTRNKHLSVGVNIADNKP